MADSHACWSTAYPGRKCGTGDLRRRSERIAVGPVPSEEVTPGTGTFMETTELPQAGTDVGTFRFCGFRPVSCGQPWIPIVKARIRKVEECVVDREGIWDLAGPERFDEARFPAAVFKEHFQRRRVVGAVVGEEDLRAVLPHGADLPAAVLEGGVRVETAKEGVPVIARDRPARDEIAPDHLGVRWRVFAAVDGASATVGFPGGACFAAAARADDVSVTIVSRDFALSAAKIAG